MRTGPNTGRNRKVGDGWASASQKDDVHLHIRMQYAWIGVVCIEFD